MKGKKTGGRSAGTPNKSTAEVKDILANVVDFNIVVGKLFELSQGVAVQKDTMLGPIVYQEKPDAGAAKILLEYMYGKPVQKIDQTTHISETQKFKIGGQEITFD